jgi:hypothetical protein
VVAHQIPGHGGNRWSSELYLTNDHPVPVTVTLGGLLPGRRRPPQPCETFAPVTREVPAHTTLLWSAAELGPDIGCAELVLGGLVIDTTEPIELTSRLVNHTETIPRSAVPLHGPGQVVAAIPLADVPAAGAYLLPGLAWHRNSCGPAEFSSSLALLNPGDQPVTVILDLPTALAEFGMRVNGEPVELPLAVVIAGQSWRQLALTPEPSLLTACMGPEPFHLLADTDGPLVVVGSVIDRLAQDPRTVVATPRD